jgi:deoxyribonuclease-4
MKLGAHVSVSGGIHTAIERAKAMGAESVQVFTQSPRAWRPTNHDPENFERFKERRAKVGIVGVFCHALYLVNLASPKKDLYEKSAATLVNTVDVGCAIDAGGVVFHVGSHLGSGLEAGLELAAPALEEALDHCAGPTWLLVENCAGAGGTIGRSIDEVAAVVDRLGRHKRLGICLDSAHLYESGYDITDRGALDRTLDEVDEKIGLDRLRLLHVNDSKTPLGSNVDRHDNIRQGVMGERLGVFLSHPALQHLPAILEVPGTDGHGPDRSEVRKLKNMHKRWMQGTHR